MKASEVIKVTLHKADCVLYPVTGRKDKVVITLSGSEGGLEHAEKLAKYLQDHGIPALALGYFKTKHSVKTLNKIELENIKAAIEWLKNSGYEKIGIEGCSKGAEYAAAAAIAFHELNCVILKISSWFYSEGMNGRTPSGTSCWSYQGKEIPYTSYKTRKLPAVKEMLKNREYNILAINTGKTINPTSIIPVEKIEAPVLLFSTEVDTIWPSKESCEKMEERLNSNQFAYPHKHICFKHMSHMMLEYCGKSIKWFIKSEKQFPEECARERVIMGQECIKCVVVYMEKDPFKEYLRESEPDKVHKGYAWSTAIGLQAVDGLRPSKYLIDTAIQNIEGEITMKEAQSLIDSYYEESTVRLSDDERTEEADKVSARIAEILSETAFSFSPNEYMSIHRKLFRGIYKHAGKMRDYNITKKEWVLDGATVVYGSASELRATLEYDFSQEKDFSYRGLSMNEIIHHLAVFVSRLLQIHIFEEGNTRTTAVFFIKYLRTLGFSATNDIFAENAWYFRNALVRANYTNLQKGIYETTEYLEAFLRNLLLDEKNELHNRNLHISGLLNREKVDIKDIKVYIQTQKVDIESAISEKGNDFTVKTTDHIRRLFEKFGVDEVFGRSAVMELLELKGSGASKLLANLVQADIIEPVSGHGKGKYKFKR